MNEDIKRYVAILNQISKGRSPSNDDLKFVANFSPKIDKDVLRKIQDESTTMGLTDEEREAAYDQLYLLGISNPQTRQAFLDKAEAVQAKNVADRISSALNTALSVADIGTAGAQIAQSKSAARQSVRPRRPTPLSADPLLQRSIADAEQGTYDTARALAPAQQAILDQYLSDLNQAKVASTGQAGTYGALGQVASMRRGRGLQQLAPIADNIRAREQARLDSLIGMKLGENQAIQQSQAQFYPTDLQQYRFEQQAAGELGAVGRENMRQSMANLGQFITPVASQLANKRKFDRLRAQTALSNYQLSDGTNVADLAKQADDDLRKRELEKMMYQAFGWEY